MKKLFAIILLLSALTANAQDFVGEHIELLSGKEVTVLPLEERKKEKGYIGFYTNENCTKMYKPGKWFTKYSALEGKKFRVVAYTRHPFVYRIKLENPETGILYYEYDPRFENKYYFEVAGGLNYPEGFFCERIESTGGGIGYNYKRTASYKVSPRVEGIRFKCPIGQGDKLTIEISIYKDAPPNDPSAEKGLTLLLADGTEIAYPEVEVYVNPDTNLYRFDVSKDPSKSDLGRLKNTLITGFKLGAYMQTVTKGQILQNYLNCFDKIR